jgi:hypothetical protein
LTTAGQEQLDLAGEKLLGSDQDSFVTVYLKAGFTDKETA